VCVCVCERERERELAGEIDREGVWEREGGVEREGLVRNREWVERKRRREKGIERVQEGGGERKRGWEGVFSLQVLSHSAPFYYLSFSLL
jgi:hypothetical protein